jgi:hypothetical protein
MADMKQEWNQTGLSRQRFGGAVNDIALQQTAMVPAGSAETPIVWQMGTVWGTVTSEIVLADQPRHAIQ